MKVSTYVYWCAALYAGVAFSVAHAHYPHDVHKFIALSPSFSADSTAFIAQKQASSTRPEVALVSRNGGLSWEYNPAGMDSISSFRSATVSPLYSTDNTVFMTTKSEGVYRSVDRGRTWGTVNQGLPTLELNGSAAGRDAIGRVVLFVSGIDGGLFRSTNSGSSWEGVLTENVLLSAFSVSPGFAVDRTVLAGDLSGMLFISQDDGTSFSQLASLAGVGAIIRIAFAHDYLTSHEMYIGTSVGLYHSNDAGNTFIKVDSFGTKLVSALVLSPAYGTDSTLFAATPTQGVFKSTDSGKTWVLHETGKPLSEQTTYHYTDLQISDGFATDGVVFLATFEGLFHSDDGGLSWSELETRPPNLIMDVALSPNFMQDGLIVVATYGGGLYVSQNRGTSWRVSNNGISGTYIYQVAVRKGIGVDPILFASHAGNALISLDGGVSWTNKDLSGVPPNGCIASAMDVSPDFAFDETIFLGCRKEGLIVTRDGGGTWQKLITKEQLSPGFITSVKVSPNFAMDSTVFVTDQRGGVARSRDVGVTWESTTEGLQGFGTWFGGRSIAFSPNFLNDNAVAAVTPKGVFGSVDGGTQWRPTPDPTSPIATGVIEHIEISPDFQFDRMLLVSVRGKGLFRSNDAGFSWNQIALGLLKNGFELKGFVFSPDFVQDGTIIGYGHNHLLRSIDRGETFKLIDIPFTRHEDMRDQSVNYFGQWTHVNSKPASAKTFRASETAGGEAELSFFGTGISWIGVRADILGIAEVYIDGILVATVDQYNPTPVWQQRLYAIENLPLGLHEIRIMVTNLKHPSATGNWTIIDAFDVLR